MHPDQFGKITAQQLEVILGVFDELQHDVSESPEWFSDKDFFDVLQPVSQELSWGVFYELPFLHHLFAALEAFGVVAPFIAAIKSDDQAGNILKIAEQSNDPHFFDHLGAIDNHTKWLLLAFTISCERSLRCFSLYSCSINSLIQKARTEPTGNDEAIFTAVRLDPGALQAPTIASRIAWATMRNETVFLDELKGAINEPHQTRFPYQKLRIAELILREVNGFSRPRADVYDLLSERLRLYDKEHQRKGSAVKALFALFEKWRKESTN